MRWSGSASSARTKRMPDRAGATGCRSWRSDRRVARLDAAHAPLWIAAERLPQFQALWPAASLEPAIAAPAAYAEREWSREEALVEILRGRLEGLGPVTAETLAAPLGLAPAEVAAALAALEAEGFAMRGRFTPGAEAEEWCERRLLARIHGYTVKRLRAEIEPVAARDFLRFLLGWQRVDRRRADGRAAMRSIPWSASSKASRRPPAPGRARSCRRGSPATSRPGSTIAASPGMSPGRGCGRARGERATDEQATDDRTAARARRDAGAHHADHADRAPSRRAVGLAVDPGGGRPARATGRSWFSITFARMAPRSSTSSWTAPACCAPRSKRRWANWWRSAW